MLDPSALLEVYEFFRNPFYSLLLAYARWFTFASVFAAFTWATINRGPIRSGIAFILAIPMALHLFETNGDVIGKLPTGELAMLMAKEALLGFLLGVVASLPIWIADICGGTLAGIRQESSGEDKFGSSSFGTVFVLIAIGILVYNDGLKLILRSVYDSYAVWPVLDFMPVFSPQAAGALLSLIDLTFGSALTIAAPFIMTWVIVDIWVGIAQRSAGRLDIGRNNDLIKALFALALLVLLIQPITNSLITMTHEMADLIGLLYLFFEDA